MPNSLKGKGALLNVAQYDSFLVATLWIHQGQRRITVYRSPVVQDTDEFMEPVYDLLHEMCFYTLQQERVEDASMMFGEATRTVYAAYAECPGESIEHVCRHDRTESLVSEPA